MFRDDNWDLKILKEHIRKEVQNEDLHMFASTLTENRVNFNHLPNDNSRGNVKDFRPHTFSFNISEWKIYAECAKIIGRIFLEFCPNFKFSRALMHNHVSHEYSLQMSQKSTILSLPIINANESKYDDCVSILRTYEKWIAECSSRAAR